MVVYIKQQIYIILLTCVDMAVIENTKHTIVASRQPAIHLLRVIICSTKMLSIS